MVAYCVTALAAFSLNKRPLGDSNDDKNSHF